jgi:hypothetical protein
MLEKILTEKMSNHCCCVSSNNKIHSEKNITIGNNKRKTIESEIDGLNKSLVKEKLDESIVINDHRDSDIINDDDVSKKSSTCSCIIQNENIRRQSWSYDNISKLIFLMNVKNFELTAQ